MIGGMSTGSADHPVFPRKNHRSAEEQRGYPCNIAITLIGNSLSPTHFPGHNFENPYPAREVRDSHRRKMKSLAGVHIDTYRCYGRNAVSGAGFVRPLKGHCTKTGHGVVDGLHSIENTDSCGSVFLIDEKNRKRTTGLFFDSFLSFSGWCGVRGSSEVTLLIERSGGRVSKGL